MADPNRPKIAEGIITGASFPVGDKLGMLTLDFAKRHKYGETAGLLLFDDATAVEVDGVLVIEPGAVLTYLLGNRCSAKVWLRPEFDGTAVKAEFTTIPEKPS